MTKIQYFTSGLLLSAILILFSCNDDINLNADIQGNTQFIETQYTDTFTVETAVGIWDTVETTMSPYMLVGNSDDEYFGKLSVNAFSQFLIPLDSIDFLDSDGVKGTLDSAIFSISIDESYGDTLESQIIQIHVINEILDTTHTYYQDDEIAYGDKIAEFTIDENTDLTQPLRVNLDAEWAQRFYEAGGQDELLNQENFEKWFAGIRISAVGGNSIHKVNQLSADTYLGFYYHTETDTLTQKFATQTIYYAGYRFNQITTDLSTSKYLAGLTHETEISTKEINGLGFVREGSGIYTKVRFPNLDRFEAGENIYINRAELIIESADENYLTPNKIQPIGLTFNLLDENGDLVQNAEFADEQYVLRELRDGSVHIGYTDGRLVASYFSSGRTYQDVRMTSYIQDVINGIRPNYGFAIRPYRDDVGASTLLFPDNDAEFKNFKLRIYYTQTK